MRLSSVCAHATAKQQRRNGQNEIRGLAIVYQLLICMSADLKCRENSIFFEAELRTRLRDRVNGRTLVTR